jgi:hypothetical protein
MRKVHLKNKRPNISQENAALGIITALERQHVGRSIYRATRNQFTLTSDGR